MINYDDCAHLSLGCIANAPELCFLTDGVKRREIFKQNRLTVGRRLRCECRSPRHGARDKMVDFRA